MVLSGQAHGKLLLFGEHAVVQGYPALGLTLPLSTRVWLSQARDTPPPDIWRSTPTHTQLIRTLVPYLGHAAQTLWQQHPWHAHIESNVPQARGLGSSAALTGAVARAFAQGIRPPLSQQMVWRMAHEAEHKYHGHPSGVDTALALGSGLIAVTPTKDGLPRLRACAASPFALVVGTLPRRSDTRSLVQQVQRQVETRGRKTREVLERLGRLAVVPPTLQNADAVLGERANEAHGLLQTLGLSTPAVDQSLLTGLAAGAHGGKLSGAGGGGAFVLFCEDPDTAHRVSDAIHHRFQDDPPPDRPRVMIFLWQGHSLSQVQDKETVA